MYAVIRRANTWQAVLWQVLFPLLDNVIIQSDNASSEKVSQSAVIMMHHSRNTAQKQWAETKVLTISGVVRVFNTKRKLLKSMEDYSKAWLLLLEYVEKMALSDTAEVSLAALKSLQEMIVSSGKNMLQELPRDLLSSLLSLFRGRTDPAGGRRESKGSELVSLLEGLAECGNAEDQVHLELVGVLFVSLPTSAHRLHPDLQQPVSLHQGGLSEQRLRGAGERPALLRSDSHRPRHGGPQCPQPRSRGTTNHNYAMIVSWQESDWRTLSQAAMDVVKETELLALGPSPSLIPEIFEIYFKFVKAAFDSRAEKDLSAKFRDRLSTLGESAAEHIGDFFHASAASAGGTFPLDNILPRIVETLQAPLKHKVPTVVNKLYPVEVSFQYFMSIPF